MTLERGDPAPLVATLRSAADGLPLRAWGCTRRMIDALIATAD